MNDPKAPSDCLKVDGIDAHFELALNLHWSRNNDANDFWEALGDDLGATTQNPCVIVRTVFQKTIKAVR